MRSSAARIDNDPETPGAEQRFQELRTELERLVENDPRLTICRADPVRDGAEFDGGMIVRPREPALDRPAELRVAPCVAEVFLQPERSETRSVLALEEGYCIDTCETGSAQELARALLGTLENHLAWLSHASDPET